MAREEAVSADEPVPGEEPRAISVDDLRSIGEAAGLDRVGVTSADPFDDARASIESRKAAGFDGGMQFTFRNPARSTEPQRALPTARTLVVGARAYASTVPGRPPGPHGRVARYAIEDVYGELRSGLDAIAARLDDQGWQTRVLLDDNALVDRAAAYRAGLGWYGKNANVLVPGAGSWFVLGSVLTDAVVPLSDDVVADGCGSCNRCIEGCPTRAIVAPGVVDGRRCLAWLLQATGDFPEEFRVALGDRIYGCDDCQEVCPPNRRARRSESVTASPDAAWVSLVELLEVDDEELIERHGRWYIPRRDPRYLRRNALVALGNTGDAGEAAVVEVIGRYAACDDPMLRRHAAWAASQLDLDEARR